MKEREYRKSPAKEVRALEREAFWKLAGQLGGRNASIWAIEFLKVAQVRTERQPGLLFRALQNPPGRRYAMRRWLCFWLAAIASMLFYLAYAAKLSFWQRGLRPQRMVGRGVALHPEWSTRTRHVLQAVPDAQPEIEFVVLIGRIHQNSVEIAKEWKNHAPGTENLSVLIPFSFAGFIRGFTRLLPEFRRGAAAALRAPLEVGWRENAAISFRVINGLVASEWWVETFSESVSDVTFGITGTADTTLLERAMHSQGVKTLHAVHGQATGPNFYGISDIALFRTGHDARQYQSLGCYNNCNAQVAEYRMRPPSPRGILVLTNITHPANPEYLCSGVESDIAVLECVYHALQLISASELPKYWKPHPVINSIPSTESKNLRKKAQALGFKEILLDEDFKKISTSVCWIVSTPSTVLLDLLAKGVVGYLLDPLCVVTDEALSKFSLIPTDVDALAFKLVDMESGDRAAEEVKKLFAAVQPAKQLSLNGPN